MKNTIYIVFSMLLITSCGPQAPHPNEISEHKPVSDFVQNPQIKIKPDFDIQGHRGARAYFPENTLHGMISALRFKGMTTLEMDVVVSKDNQVVLSHEPWMSSEICSFSNGDRLMPFHDEKFRLYDMTYEEIKKFDCGMRWDKNFPKQKPKAQVKPLLSEVLEAVIEYSAEKQLPDVNFNIEIKSHPDWDNFMTPPPDKFARLVYDVIARAGLQKRVTIQSFDPRSLIAMNKIDPQVALVLLVEKAEDVETRLAELSFIPYAFSPNYTFLDKPMVEKMQAKGMKVIPWTVNDSLEMMKLIEMGVDGIITDDPGLCIRVADLYR